LVIGGLGFIGTAVVRKLLERGYWVEVWDDLRTGQEGRLEGHDRLSVKLVDATKPETWKVQASYAVAINCAGVSLTDDPPMDIVSVDTAITTAMMCHLPAASLIMLSEASITGPSSSLDPHNEVNGDNAVDWPSRSKLICEKMLSQGEQPWASIRLPKVVYGKGQRIDSRYGIVESVISAALDSTPVVFERNGLDRFDMVSVEDVASLVADVAEKLPKSLPKPVINACKGKHYSPDELVDLVRSLGYAANVTKRTGGVPKEWCYPASRPATIVYRWRPKFEIEQYVSDSLPVKE